MTPPCSPARRALGILLIPAAELRIEGADAVILNIGVEEAARGPVVRGPAAVACTSRRFAARGRAASVLPPGRVHRFADRALPRLLRRHRILPFPRAAAQSERARRASGGTFRQTAPGHVRRAPPEILRAKFFAARRGKPSGRAHRGSGVRGDPRGSHPTGQPVGWCLPAPGVAVFPFFRPSHPRAAARLETHANAQGAPRLPPPRNP